MSHFVNIFHGQRGKLGQPLQSDLGCGAWVEPLSPLHSQVLKVHGYHCNLPFAAFTLQAPGVEVLVAWQSWWVLEGVCGLAAHLPRRCAQQILMWQNVFKNSRESVCKLLIYLSWNLLLTLNLFALNNSILSSEWLVLFVDGLQEWTQTFQHL